MAFLDEELRRVNRSGRVGRRTVGKLVKVCLTTGDEVWGLVHVEIQGRREEGFGERIFVYRYRLFDRFRMPVTTLVVLTDGDAEWRPEGYRDELLGTELVLPSASLQFKRFSEHRTPCATWPESEKSEAIWPKLAPCICPPA